MSDPIVFAPIFQERVWGGRRLAERFAKALPDEAVIGESWEVVDREDHQSVVVAGTFEGTSLHELWSKRREEVFGARGVASDADRFPILIKLLDATDTLSVQVHPPASVAPRLGGEPKTEMWVLLGSDPGAHLFLGMRAGVGREAFSAALEAGEDVSAMLQRVEVADGDVAFLPSGRVHAIGAGCVIAEIQQSSDTTYRVFDFNRPGLDGELRELHVEQSLESIDFEDVEPSLVRADGDVLVDTDLFVVERLHVDAERAAAPAGECAILCATDGALRCGSLRLAAGEWFLVPANTSANATLAPDGDAPVSVLRVLLPGAG